MFKVFLVFCLITYIVCDDPCYVSTTSIINSSCGSESNPCDSLDACMDIIQDGGSVLMFGGNYTSNGCGVITKSVSITSYEGDVVINGGIGGSRTGCFDITSSDVSFELSSVTVEGNRNGIYTEVNPTIELDDVLMNNTPNNIFARKSTPDVTISNSEFLDGDLNLVSYQDYSDNSISITTSIFRNAPGFIIENQAGVSIAAVGNVVITECEFFNTIIEILYGELSLASSRFTNITGNVNGIVITEFSNATITNISIDNSYVGLGVNAGLKFISSSFSVSNTKLYNLTSNEYTGIYIVNSNGTITDATIKNCTSSRYGGAFGIQATDPTFVQIHNSDISDNYAGKEGGAFSFNGDGGITLEIVDCKITDNYATTYATFYCSPFSTNYQINLVDTYIENNSPQATNCPIQY
eukprot:TRINITY_DN4848_c0_g5_i1.p1 TRINITY_DN4848_c0_g5~~TRINITY_DN4848_c0_g5_i1.p1  ORF type:complete len:410 (-),score=108.25 TRINITY_DN4848_c0_g5_i1:188-1417(-)